MNSKKVGDIFESQQAACTMLLVLINIRVVSRPAVFVYMRRIVLETWTTCVQPWIATFNLIDAALLCSNLHRLH